MAPYQEQAQAAPGGFQGQEQAHFAPPHDQPQQGGFTDTHGGGYPGQQQQQLGGYAQQQPGQYQGQQPGGYQGQPQGGFPGAGDQQPTTQMPAGGYFPGQQQAGGWPADGGQQGQPGYPGQPGFPGQPGQPGPYQGGGPPPKKKGNGLLIALIILAVILAGALVWSLLSYFGADKSPAPDAAPSESVTQTIEPTPEPEATVEEEPTPEPSEEPTEEPTEEDPGLEEEEYFLMTLHEDAVQMKPGEAAGFISDRVLIGQTLPVGDFAIMGIEENFEPGADSLFCKEPADGRSTMRVDLKLDAKEVLHTYQFLGPEFRAFDADGNEVGQTRFTLYSAAEGCFDGTDTEAIPTDLGTTDTYEGAILIHVDPEATTIGLSDRFGYGMNTQAWRWEIADF